MTTKQILSRREFGATTALGIGAVANRAFPAQSATQQTAPKPVEVKLERRVVDILVDGNYFAVYNFDPQHAAIYRPFFHPVMGPNDKPITQNGEFPGSLRGHYWHRALFVAHQKVNNLSFWEEVEESMQCGRIVHVGFDEVTSGPEGRFVERLEWRDLAGQPLLNEVRTVRIPHSTVDRRLLDITIKLTAVRENVEFIKTPYNLLACRVINSMCLLPQKQQYTRRFRSLVDFSPMNDGGRITNSEGKRDEDCRGARAKWCDFSGPLGDGTWGGVAMLDHPSNIRHPTPWHNWNNMTITASFTFDEPFMLQKGRDLVLAYRVLVHAGDAKKADVEAAWKQFSQVDPARSGA